MRESLSYCASWLGCRDKFLVLHHLPQPLELLLLFVFDIFEDVGRRFAGADEYARAVVELKLLGNDRRGSRGGAGRGVLVGEINRVWLDCT